MQYWILMFSITAILAGLIDFASASSSAAGIAKSLFFIFLVLFLVALISHAFRRVSTWRKGLQVPRGAPTAQCHRGPVPTSKADGV